MGETTGITWATSTYNAWMGCTRVSPGCDHCYAETLFTSRMQGQWGHHAPRRLMAESTRNNPLRWNRKAAKLGVPWRVFCSSMSDWADAEVPRAWVNALWAMVEQTPNLTWMFLTKRHARIKELLPPDFARRFPNVWLGVSVEDQKRADLRLPAMQELRRLYPDTILWVSYEPALGPVDWTPWAGVMDWLIIGGESGKDARPFDLAWAADSIKFCRAHGIAPFVKQTGVVVAKAEHYTHHTGAEMAEWPAWMQVQEFPTGRGDEEGRARRSVSETASLFSAVDGVAIGRGGTAGRAGA